MGEPLANTDNVLAAIGVLSDPAGSQIHAGNITVSTSGLPVGIRRLAREAPKVRLARAGTGRCSLNWRFAAAEAACGGERWPHLDIAPRPPRPQALSIGSARPEVRRQIMPVEKVHPLLGEARAPPGSPAPARTSPPARPRAPLALSVSPPARAGA